MLFRSLEIGAVTPQEIAVSILAELIAVKHGKFKSREAADITMQWNNLKAKGGASASAAAAPHEPAVAASTT